MNNSSFTISCWVYPVSASTLHVLYCSRPSATNQIGVTMNSSYSISLYVEMNDVVYGAGFGVLEQQTWNHITLTYDLSKFTTYKNGVYASEVIAPHNASFDVHSELYVGMNDPAIPASSWTYLDGKLDQMRFFNRALTDDEVYSLYKEREDFKAVIPVHL